LFKVLTIRRNGHKITHKSAKTRLRDFISQPGFSK
jgi:hypothetical protein